MTDSETQKVQQALDNFRIETPSWGFADTGTRFGKFLQDAAAIDLEGAQQTRLSEARFAGRNGRSNAAAQSSRRLETT